MKKKLIFLFSSMLTLSLIAFVMIQLFSTAQDSRAKQDMNKVKIVTTFYPIYMIGLNLTDQMEDIEVRSLTDLQTGCLHDYQLTTQDMKMISEADLLVVNGGGMESFIDDVMKNYPQLKIIDASQGITMLKNASSYHEDSQNESLHNEEVHEAEVEDFLKLIDENANGENASDKNANGVNSFDENASGENSVEDNVEPETVISNEEEHDDHEHSEYNPHVWLDPQLYIKQIKNVRDGLIAFIEDNDKRFTKSNQSELSKVIGLNAENYIQNTAQLDSEIEENIVSLVSASNQSFNAEQVVIFHDSFAYLANRVGMKVAFTVPLDSDTSLSAGEIAEVIDEVNQKKIKLLFTEEQYSDSIARQIQEETGAKVQIINSVVTGDGSKDSYIKAMRSNLLVLQKALQ